MASDAADYYAYLVVGAKDAPITSLGLIGACPLVAQLHIPFPVLGTTNTVGIALILDRRCRRHQAVTTVVHVFFAIFLCQTQSESSCLIRLRDSGARNFSSHDID